MLLVLSAALAARLLIPDPILRVGRARASSPKAAITAFLERQGGRHVVFVRHGPFADLHDEWVSNGAEIDAARIVWARAMPAGEDEELIAYYADRRAWRVDLGMDRRDAIDFAEVERHPAPALTSSSSEPAADVSTAQNTAASSP
jgi:hypothetical protein